MRRPQNRIYIQLSARSILRTFFRSKESGRGWDRGCDGTEMVSIQRELRVLY